MTPYIFDIAIIVQRNVELTYNPITMEKFTKEYLAEKERKKKEYQSKYYFAKTKEKRRKQSEINRLNLPPI